MKASSAVKRTPFPLGVLDSMHPNYREFDFPLQTKLWSDTGFSLGRFLARFWCGDSALRDDRAVSRKRLTLIAAGIENGDQQAQRLDHQSKAYRDAFQRVLRSPMISMDLICQINKILEQNHSRSGHVRRVQNFIGDPRNPRYIPPAAETLPGLMQDLADFANDPSITPLARAIAVHSQLLAIHPFADGNGRTARVLMDAMIHKAEPRYVSLSLNRLRNEQGYLNAIRQFGVQGQEGLRYPYWQEAFTWAEEVKASVNALVIEANQQLLARLAPLQDSEDARMILRCLWQQPIIHHNNLPATANWGDARFAVALDTLVQAGILEVRALKKPEGTMILDCPMIFQTWQRIDELVFHHEL